MWTLSQLVKDRFPRMLHGREDLIDFFLILTTLEKEKKKEKKRKARWGLEKSEYRPQTLALQANIIEVMNLRRVSIYNTSFLYFAVGCHVV